MENLTFEHLDGGVARITLASGSGNPLSPGLVGDLSQVMVALSENPPGAVVLGAGESRVFSGGFDLPAIGDYDREHLSAFFQGFLGVLDRMLRLPCPIIAAVGGHAIAGGFILTLACDFRIVGSSPKKLGLSEVDLGAAVPAGAQVLLAERTSPRTANWLSQTATLIGPEEALRLGYADELVDDANARALELARSLASKPGAGVGTTKLLLGNALADRVAEADQAGLEPFLATWFSDEAQQAIAQLVARLKG
jgi:enoyl-CoA hydratase/carnithine racemase